MSREPIKLFVDSDRQSGCPLPPYVVITPQVAKQIVDMANQPLDEMSEEDFQEDLAKVKKQLDEAVTLLKDIEEVLRQSLREKEDNNSDGPFLPVGLWVRVTNFISLTS